MIEGIVVKKIANSFWVRLGDETVVCSSPKKHKEIGIFVGDEVNVDLKEKQILSVHERKNKLIRPPVANLSKLIIVIAPIPKPDFLMLDKLMLFCLTNNIVPVLCLNKIDIADSFWIKGIEAEYNNALNIIKTSSKEGDISELLTELQGNISVLSGQSAVGKSALTKAIFPDKNVEVGELSRNDRGKNTTRHCELFQLDKNSFLVDTPGFTSLDEKLLNIPYFELPYLYPDFLEFHEGCKYKSCTHIGEGCCNVKNAVNQGRLSKGRYERYKIIFESLKKEWVKNHG